MYDVIKAQLGAAVPFAQHAGVVLTEVGDGTATARLEQTADTINHIGSQHAGALFTLGETVSGAAMAGAIAPVLMQARPLVPSATIAYSKVAKGTITATARTSEPGADLLERLRAEGRAAFEVTVSLANEEGAEVATMTVTWHVRLT